MGSFEIQKIVKFDDFNMMYIDFDILVVESCYEYLKFLIEKKFYKKKEYKNFLLIQTYSYTINSELKDFFCLKKGKKQKVLNKINGKKNIGLVLLQLKLKNFKFKNYATN